MLKNIRAVCVTAAGVAAALALTGCGSGGDSDGAAPDKKPAATPAAGTPSASGAGGAAKAGSLDGAWVSAANPGEIVILTVKSPVAIVIDGGKTCKGAVSGKDLTLVCPSGGKRTKGTVDSVDATSLKVTWEGAGTDTFQKSDAGKLPTALPSS
ncbi:MULTISPECIES: hypothetical protein [Streptomyces]|uniref:hypothetical protein n=1 Tax=Streptomyces TaxID=1883 RepID=UPI0027E2DB3F|nr:hypothetical protein [Streptomyces sp. CJ_13]